jgi:ATP-binding cassette, subfamily F, member 3
MPAALDVMRNIYVDQLSSPHQFVPSWSFFQQLPLRGVILRIPHCLLVFIALLYTVLLLSLLYFINLFNLNILTTTTTTAESLSTTEITKMAAAANTPLDVSAQIISAIESIANTAELDPPLVEHVAQVIEEELETIQSAELLETTAGDFLSMYDMIPADLTIDLLCTQLFNEMVRVGLIKDDTISDTATTPDPAAVAAAQGLRLLDSSIRIADSLDTSSDHKTTATAAAAGTDNIDKDSSGDDTSSSKPKSKKNKRRNRKKKNRNAGVVISRSERIARVEAEQKLEEDEKWVQSFLQARGRFHDSSSKDVLVQGVDLLMRGEELLGRASIEFYHGRKYGIVGRNGCGKSTLLRRLERRQIRGLPKHVFMLHVKQEAQGTDKSGLQTVIDSDTERKALLEEEAELQTNESADHSERMQEISERLTMIDAHSIEGRAIKILSGLQFTEAMMNGPTKHLSGGWRMRISLACALLLEPDVLMLDEPTNHMDLPGVLWLQQYVRNYAGTVVIVSHDTAFLNAVCTDIIHFNLKQLKYYPGNFDAFKKAREDHMKFLAHQEQLLADKRKHYMETIQRIERQAKTKRGDQKKLKTVASRKKKLERVGLEKNAKGHKYKIQKECAYRAGSVQAGGGWDKKKRKFLSSSLLEPTLPPVSFKFPEPMSLGVYGPILQFKNVSFGYPNCDTLLHDITLDITTASRISVVGYNGAGKSTFLSMIVNELTPKSGEIFRHHNLKIAYFNQHHVDGLDVTCTPLEHMLLRFPKSRELDLRAALGKFGIGGSLATQPIQLLSGGQKTRLVLASISYEGPHIMVLDEVTNHLDYDSVQALINALNAFDGGIVLVSHDQHLIKLVANEIWVVDDGTVQRFDGPFEEYAKQIVAEMSS